MRWNLTGHSAPESGRRNVEIITPNFFHISASSRKRRNKIAPVRDELGTIVSEEGAIRAAFVRHYKGIYCPLDNTQFHGLNELYSNCFPSVQPVMSDLLQAQPTDEEITRTLFCLHPNRAARPDGVNARALQSFWAMLGPTVLNQVNEIFSSARIPSDMAKSNLILVPKKEILITIMDYRPISVCNILYKLVSKLLERRMQSLIPLLVANNQTAFTLGRDIADNVMVFREVLHSFSMTSYKHHAFCFKCDMSKAFDRMSWSFVRWVLLMYGFPDPFVKWVMMCVSSARFSIVFDGHSDGFIQPTSGLRQGCALSPYIFILSSVAEVQRIVTILDQFCAISGQQIGHDKSKVWFSRATPQNMKDFVLTSFNASKASPSEIYLGSTVNARSLTHFLPLVNKIEGKLQGWKATFLSQAGKITLIKAVVELMLLHAMSTSTIPKSTLDRIQSLVRSFFWSAKDKRKMSLIAWKKLTRPKMEGGLGLRDISALNLSFNLKCCWKMATDSAVLWVQIAKGKYLREDSFWLSTRRNRFTKLWQAIMDARQVMQQHVTWQLEDGSVCGAFGQPWHNFWTQVNPSSSRQRRFFVSYFLNPSGQWDCGKLIEEFGFAIALFISMSIKPPLLEPTRADRLIFTYARNGQFTLKRAYHLVAPEVAPPNFPPDLISLIWNTKGLLPRIRLFLWKIMHNGLPLGDLIGRRISNTSRPCSLCGFHAETIQHALFKCPWAQSLWFASSLGLHTDDLPENIPVLLKMILGTVREDRTCIVANHLWAL
ncbi:hypothetical protein LUZ63_002307 [Rhynchospora breviuscula]|uniref:Reverse transcriptase domain-containing protein n=1 Tax=Rhynchospora breviuscula TaxID=2022672 RepID=A0A9Q0CZ16_9POAL|nr:hypothetical protein LUZ63_002307 [Rhynchospora breviuscula]